MGTKNRPGDFDCYSKAEPDEPMFVLLARDPCAHALVGLWASINSAPGPIREKRVREALLVLEAAARRLPGQDAEKIEEAFNCVHAMVQWRGEHEECDRCGGYSSLRRGRASQECTGECDLAPRLPRG